MEAFHRFKVLRFQGLKDLRSLRIAGQPKAAVPTYADSYVPRRRFLTKRAGGVVEHGEGQEEDQEEDCGGYYEFQQLFAGAFEMHEEEGDE